MINLHSFSLKCFGSLLVKSFFFLLNNWQLDKQTEEDILCQLLFQVIEDSKYFCFVFFRDISLNTFVIRAVRFSDMSMILVSFWKT